MQLWSDFLYRWNWTNLGVDAGMRGQSDDPMQIYTNLEVDACARKEIEWYYPDGGGTSLDNKIYVPRLYYVVRAYDGSGKTLKNFKTGYRLGRIEVTRLTTHRIFDVSGDDIFLAVKFFGEFDPDSRYQLEYFDDVYFLFDRDKALEDLAYGWSPK